MEYEELKDEGAKIYYYFINNSEETQSNQLAHAKPEIWKNMVQAEIDWVNNIFDFPTGEKQFPDALNDVRKYINGAIFRFIDKYKIKLKPHELKGLKIQIDKLITAKSSEELYEIMTRVLDIIK
jgi:hypothetical protein